MRVCLRFAVCFVGCLLFVVCFLSLVVVCYGLFVGRCLPCVVWRCVLFVDCCRSMFVVC